MREGEKLSSERYLREILKLKLKKGEELTWGDVVMALYNVGEDELARQVAKTQHRGTYTIDNIVCHCT